MYSEKVLDKSISFGAVDFLYPKNTQKDIGHSKATPRAFLGHLGTRALKALGHSSTWDTQVLEGHLDTKALMHSDKALYLADLQHGGWKKHQKNNKLL